MSEPIAVCVPVRDEAERLPRFLDALAAQAGGLAVLCVLFDGCGDASEAIVADRAADLPFAVRTRSVERSEANAGRARRGAMALGMAALGGVGTIVSTDADSVPAADWLAATRAARAQADVVAGRIVRMGAPVPLQDRVELYYDQLFALRRAIDPVAWEAPHTHHYTSGASLAFDARAYAAMGGFEAVAAAEDARIVDAAHRAGLRVRRDASVVVATSSRRRGRAEGGLAEHLRRIDVGVAMPTMAHPADCARRYRLYARARAAFADPGGLTAESAAIASAAPNAEAFAHRVVGDIPGGERLVTLDVAEAALAALADAVQEAA